MKFKNIAIAIIIMTFLIVGGYIFFLQSYGRQSVSYDKIMPIAACGNAEAIYIVGNTYDFDGEVLTSNIYGLDE